jgi:hypothetical protein
MHGNGKARAALSHRRRRRRDTVGPALRAAVVVSIHACQAGAAF